MCFCATVNLKTQLLRYLIICEYWSLFWWPSGIEERQRMVTLKKFSYKIINVISMQPGFCNLTLFWVVCSSQPSGKRNKAWSACWQWHSSSSHRRCRIPTWCSTASMCTTLAPYTNPLHHPWMRHARLLTTEFREHHSQSTVPLWQPCPKNICLGRGHAQHAPTSTTQGALCARAVAWSTAQVSVKLKAMAMYVSCCTQVKQLWFSQSSDHVRH